MVEAFAIASPPALLFCAIALRYLRYLGRGGPFAGPLSLQEVRVAFALQCASWVIFLGGVAAVVWVCRPTLWKIVVMVLGMVVLRISAGSSWHNVKLHSLGPFSQYQVGLMTLDFFMYLTAAPVMFVKVRPRRFKVHNLTNDTIFNVELYPDQFTDVLKLLGQWGALDPRYRTEFANVAAVALYPGRRLRSKFFTYKLLTKNDLE